MKTYKAPDNSLHEIEQEFEHWLPVGCVPITEQEAQAIRAVVSQANRPDEIRGRLAAIDIASIRPARAIAMALAAGQAAPTFDANKLAALEAEAATLRAELASLGN